MITWKKKQKKINSFFHKGNCWKINSIFFFGILLSDQMSKKHESSVDNFIHSLVADHFQDHQILSKHEFYNHYLYYTLSTYTLFTHSLNSLAEGSK